jgi:hypothetical protein
MWEEGSDGLVSGVVRGRLDSAVDSYAQCFF